MTRHAWVAVAVAVSVLSCSVPKDGAGRARSERGAALFQAQCALCHGEKGRGDGLAASYLWPPPRDFGKARFRLVSTVNGVPTDEDLDLVLRRGMPGSAMPSFERLSAADRRELVAEVRHLAIEGRVRDLEREGQSAASARETARRELTPGARLDPGPAAQLSAGTLARGAGLYDQHCAACHGADARGKSPPGAWSEAGEFQWARDFTAGVLKGGASHEQLAWRILAGMPGSVMRPTHLDDPADIAALIAYVQSVLPPGTEDRLVQTPVRLRVHRVDTSLPAGPDDVQWSAAEERHLSLAPLAWREESVLGLSVAALHDRKRLAVRVRWRDTTREDRAGGPSAQGDGVALQLTAESEPPLFAMGTHRHPVEIWHWKPFDADDVSALLEQLPHADPLAGRAQLDVPIYIPAPSGPARAVLAEGFGSAPGFESASLEIDSAVRWASGEWSVVLTRSLVPPTPRQVDLAPGSSRKIAFAIWNGSARDRDSQKSITIWHALDIDP